MIFTGSAAAACVVSVTVVAVGVGVAAWVVAPESSVVPAAEPSPPSGSFFPESPEKKSLMPLIISSPLCVFESLLLSSFLLSDPYFSRILSISSSERLSMISSISTSFSSLACTQPESISTHTSKIDKTLLNIYVSLRLPQNVIFITPALRNRSPLLSRDLWVPVLFEILPCLH